MPSNSLAVLYGLARDAAARELLGSDCDIEIGPIDEANRRVEPRRLTSALRRNGGFGLVALVGVQSNQFARALDIARPFRAVGQPVVIGGFHVSGCLTMLPELAPDLREALDLGISLFAGETEGRFDRLLLDAATGSLAPIYNHLDTLPTIAGTPVPFLLHDHVSRTLGNYSAFDAGRGCPYQCSFCTIINVQGRKSRVRSAEDVERIIRRNWSERIDRLFITDDNFARNKDWREIFARIIRLREEEGIRVGLTVQVDTRSHKIPDFIATAARAGVERVFIGIDSVNPKTLIAIKKRQNRIAEYRDLLLTWKRAGVLIYADYILGFPNDSATSIRQDIEMIKRELPIDIMVFYCLTPLPGSEDHQKLWREGVWMDPDLNKYDTEHAVLAHPQMSKAEWEDVYRAAWDLYYTPEHCETIMLRAATAGISLAAVAAPLLYFSQFVRVEKVHPLQGGVWRRKHRRDRRPGFAVEPAWRFYPKYAWECGSKLGRFTIAGARLWHMRRQIERDPSRMGTATPPWVRSQRASPTPLSLPASRARRRMPLSPMRV
jgi:hypothetical protein